MIKISYSQLACLSCVILLLATSCSKAPESKASVELAVDGQTVFKEMDLSLENLMLSHNINNSILSTCLLSRFLSDSIKSDVSKQANHVSNVTTAESTLKVGIIPTQPDGLIRCTSGFDKNFPKAVKNLSGCERYKSDRQQHQYSLKLLEKLQSEYGMKRNAFWKLYTFENDGKKSKERINTVQITNENISCKSSLRRESD